MLEENGLIPFYDWCVSHKLYGKIGNEYKKMSDPESVRISRIQRELINKYNSPKLHYISKQFIYNILHSTEIIKIKCDRCGNEVEDKIRVIYIRFVNGNENYKSFMCGNMYCMTDERKKEFEKSEGYNEFKNTLTRQLKYTSNDRVIIKLDNDNYISMERGLSDFIKRYIKTRELIKEYTIQENEEIIFEDTDITANFVVAPREVHISDGIVIKWLNYNIDKKWCSELIDTMCLFAESKWFKFHYSICNSLIFRTKTKESNSIMMNIIQLNTLYMHYYNEISEIDNREIKEIIDKLPMICDDIRIVIYGYLYD